MFYSNNINEEIYTQNMEQIKHLNADWLKLRKSQEYRIGMVICELASHIKKLNFSAAYHSLKRWITPKKHKNSSIKHYKSQNNTDVNYFSNEKIAIYTTIYGEYDKLLEPYCKPDNCDFYVFSDFKNISDNSTWKYLKTPDIIKDFSNINKNRYLKFHPHEFFKDYKFSIYVDGNVQIISDLTEYINSISKYGISTHLHDSRNCIYDEMDVIQKIGKESKANLKTHKKYILSTGMPHNYGLLQCNVIVRNHHLPICISIMEDWWQEFSTYSKRDQISLPHVLYMHNIKAEEIGTLGNSVYLNPSFRIVLHK